MNHNPSRLRLKQSTALLIVLLLAMGTSGCRQVLLIGKVLYGDPKQPAPFMLGTQTDLEEGEHRILVITSSSVQTALDGDTAVSIDVLDGLTRQLKRKGIQVVSPGKVSTWIDDNGGVLEDPADLLEDFETDYIVHIEIKKFTLKEDHSPSLLRARFSGIVTAYEVQKKGDQKRIKEVWDAEFSEVHPRNHPISHEKISKELFQQQAIKRLTAQLSRLFYAHAAADTIE